MKRHVVAIIFCALVSGSCATMPAITPMNATEIGPVQDRCGAPFLREKYRLMHSITFAIQNGPTMSIIGVLRADPHTRRIDVALMTIEGLIVFEATQEKTLTVHRSLPSFGSPEFARMMIEDISLAVFSPGDEPHVVGTTLENVPLCRYEQSDETVVDIEKVSANYWRVNKYSPKKKLQRSIEFRSIDAKGLPEEIILKGHESISYTLTLELVSADKE